MSHTVSKYTMADYDNLLKGLEHDASINQNNDETSMLDDPSYHLTKTVALNYD